MHHNIAPGLILYVGKDAVLEIGDLFSVSHDAKIYCLKHIRIGYNNMWSYYNVIMDNDGHPIYDAKEEIINGSSDVVFDDNIWMGCRCTVLKGSHILGSTVIAAGSLLNKKNRVPECHYFLGRKGSETKYPLEKRTYGRDLTN